MSTTTAITIGLARADGDQPLAEGQRRGMPPEILAHLLMSSGLWEDHATTYFASELRRRRVVDVLKALAAI